MTTAPATVTIAFATDSFFRYFTGVALFSLLEHISPGTRYEILILANSFTDADKALFERLVAPHANVSLVFLDMRQKIAEIGADKFYTGHYALANYYRLFLPELLPNHDRVLYLDSDIIVQADVRELFETDLGNSPVAAIIDWPATSFPLTFPQLEYFLYNRRILHIKNIAKCFNSGVLIMDLKRLRASSFAQDIRREIQSGIPFQMVDQDILNRLFNGTACYLHPSWNFITHTQGDKRIADAKIVHLSNIKPWFSRERANADLWWSVADRTFFAEEMKAFIYNHPKRIQYLEECERYYHAILRSTAWRLAVLFRLPGNTRVFLRKLFTFARMTPDSVRANDAKQP